MVFDSQVVHKRHVKAIKIRRNVVWQKLKKINNGKRKGIFLSICSYCYDRNKSRSQLHKILKYTWRAFYAFLVQFCGRFQKRSQRAR